MTQITWDSFSNAELGDGDHIDFAPKPGATNEAMVEIALQSDATHWVAIALDTNDAFKFHVEVSTDSRFNFVSLPAAFITPTATIIFKKTMGPPLYFHNNGSYELGDLSRYIKPGTRVTFHWTRDAFVEPGAVNTPPVDNGGQQAVAGTVSDALGGASRLYQLLGSLEKLLSEKYAFDVFAPNSINFGILVTYRQKWVPGNYQVGGLVSSIPLAPKEIRRYTTRTVTKKTRAVKEVDDSLQIRKRESADTSRVDAEIVENAKNHTTFNVMAHESFGSDALVKVDSTQTSNNDQSHESTQTKKDFRESVLKSAEEYKRQHRTEIDTSESQETETTTFHEIQNPNEELPVTYLFYELQRTYHISEKIHKLTPVIFVANDVPSPHQINDAWLLEHAWILNHVILDDSFRPALEYLSKSFVGAEINVRILTDNAVAQKNLVTTLSQQMVTENQVLSSGQQDIKNAVLSYVDKKGQQGIFDAIKSVFDPLGLTQKVDTGQVSAAQSMVDYAKDTLDRAEKEKARLQSQLEIAVTAMQAAIDKLSSAVQDLYDNVTAIDRLRLHVKDNILYYMQAIWDHEPPDQRYFRLYKIDVPMITEKSVGITAAVNKAESQLANALSGKTGYSISLPMPDVTFPTKKLVEVADLDNLLGYKGNYMIFPLKENNYLTLHMMQDYLDIGDEITVRDPDAFGNYTLDELQELSTCVYEKEKDHHTFFEYQEQFKQVIIDRLTSSRTDDDLVIVPTTSLYIEALLGTHPLLEDFKLLHRALDVKKVQAEVRHAELENIRLAARALKGKDGDPDIEKKIIIESGDKNITIQPDGN